MDDFVVKEDGDEAGDDEIVDALEVALKRLGRGGRGRNDGVVVGEFGVVDVGVGEGAPG